MNFQSAFHYGIVGDGADALIAAYGSSIAMGIPSESEQPKAWKCTTCTFHNSEKLGRFCSMCGSRRLETKKETTTLYRESDWSNHSESGDCLAALPPNENTRQNGSIHQQLPKQRATTFQKEIDWSNHRGGHDYAAGSPRIEAEGEYGYVQQPTTFDRENDWSDHRGGDDYLGELPRNESVATTRQGGSTCQSPPRQRDTTFYQENHMGSGDYLAQLSPNSHVASSRELVMSPAHQRATVCTNTQSPPPSTFDRRSMQDGLDKSFSVLNLMDDLPISEEPKKSAKLSEKDFQMSFANWSISDNGAWSCDECTFVNTNPLHLTCELCRQNRPSRKTAKQSKNVIQEMMETSFRTGQHDFLRRQQEKIEEVEERVIANERVEEIMEMQMEMMEEFKDEKNEVQNERGRVPNGMSLTRRAKMAEEYIQQLEEVRQQEREEQEQMEQTLEKKRRELGMEHMNTQRAHEMQASSARSLEQSEETQVRGQERLLSQWKQSWKGREIDVAAIRRRQKAIFERLQGGL